VPGLSSVLGKLIDEEFKRAAGTKIMHPKDVAAVREKDSAFKMKVEGVRDSVTSARERWMVLDLKATETILEDVEM